MDESKAQPRPFNARKQMAMAAALRRWSPSSPDDIKKQAQRLAAIKEDAERQVAEALKGILSQLPPDDARVHAGMTQSLRWDSTAQLRAADALLQTVGLPRKARVAVLTLQLSKNETERVDAMLSVARRYNAGQQKDELRWKRAKRAYLEAHRRGKPHKAVADAMAAGHFKKSAIYERAKLEKWLDQVDR